MLNDPNIREQRSHAELQQDVARAAFRLGATYELTDLGNPVDPLDDLIYIILSGQTNETNYQRTFAALKAAFPGWTGLSTALLSDVAIPLATGGLALQKAAYVQAILIKIEADFGKPSLARLRAWPTSRAEEYLCSLPGVGIKTARCVLMYTLNRQVFPADVNCLRIMERLGWIVWNHQRAENLADEVQDLVPLPLRKSLHIGLVQHGRAQCTPRTPSCAACCLAELCHHTERGSVARPTVIDLCCGAGGFSWGFMQAGYQILLGVDTCPHALTTFETNIPGARSLNADVTGESTLGKIKNLLGKATPNVVIAGPPCQGFSRAGDRNADDPRNSVLRATMRLAVQLAPDVIVFENVLNVRNEAFIHHFDQTMAVARRAGYRFGHAVLRADAFGVAQARKRVVLVATRVGSRTQLVEALNALEIRPPVPDITVSDALEGVPSRPTRFGSLANHDVMHHSARVIQKIRRIAPGEGPLSYRKLDPNKLAPTLICGHRALPCHYAVPRTITAREAARIQGFPDNFQFYGPKGHQMQQVANAVPPRLALGLAVAISEILGVKIVPELQTLIGETLSRITISPTVSRPRATGPISP